MQLLHHFAHAALGIALDVEGHDGIVHAQAEEEPAVAVILAEGDADSLAVGLAGFRITLSEPCWLCGGGGGEEETFSVAGGTVEEAAKTPPAEARARLMQSAFRMRFFTICTSSDSVQS